MNAPSPGIDRLLARLVLGSSEAQASALTALQDPGRAEAAVERARVLKIAPRLHERISTNDIRLPATARERLRQILKMSVIGSMFAARRAADIFAAFESRGIAAAAFKGIGLMGNLYRTPSRRMTGDIDLLVAERDLLPALAVLTDQGFRPALPIDGLLEMMRKEAYPTHRFLVFSGGGLEVDVHWQINNSPPPPLRVPTLIGRSESVPLGGGSIRAVAPADAILLTVHHTVRESFQAEASVKDLCDLDAWCAEPHRWSASDVVSRASEADLLTSLLACTRILAAGNADGRAAETAAEADRSASPAERADARRLIDFFEFQLDGVPVNHDILKLLSGVSIARFVAQRTRHRDQNRKIRELARAREPARPHGWARIAGLLRSLVALSPARWRAYRALSAQQRAMRKSGSAARPERD